MTGFVILNRGNAQVTFIQEILEETPMPEWHLEGIYTDPAALPKDIPVLVTCALPSQKQALWDQSQGARPTAPTFIHPTACVSRQARVGPGTIINPFARIGPHAEVGKGCMIHSYANVNHDCTVGDFCNIASRVTLCGHVRIGHRVQLWVGCTIAPKVQVGDDALIHVHTSIYRSVGPGQIWAGSPGKQVHHER